MVDVTLAERPGEATAAGDWAFGPIVDADAHIDPPYDMWKTYLPGHLRDLAPVIEEGEECDWIIF